MPVAVCRLLRIPFLMPFVSVCVGCFRCRFPFVLVAVCVGCCMYRLLLLVSVAFQAGCRLCWLPSGVLDLILSNYLVSLEMESSANIESLIASLETQIQRILGYFLAFLGNSGTQ